MISCRRISAALGVLVAATAIAGCSDENSGVVARKFVDSVIVGRDREAALAISVDPARSRLQRSGDPVREFVGDAAARPAVTYDETSRHLEGDETRVLYALHMVGQTGEVYLSVRLRRVGTGWRVFDYDFALTGGNSSDSPAAAKPQ